MSKEFSETGGMSLETMRYLLAEKSVTQEQLDAMILSGAEMERVHELMPPWTITSEVGNGVVSKLMERSVRADDEAHWHKLGGFNVDELTDMVGVMREDQTSVGGEFKHIEDGRHWQYLEIAAYLPAGPISLGDVKRTMLAEAYLQQAGYVPVPEAEE